MRQLWLTALAGVHKVPREETRAAVEQALRASGRGARFEILAARILLLGSDFDAALRAIERAEAAAATREEADLARLSRSVAGGMLGDFQTSIAAFERLGAAESLPRLVAALQLCVNVAAPAAARGWAQRIESHPAAGPEHLLRVAELLHRVGEDESAIAVIRNLLASPRLQSAERRAAAQVLLACRACDEAAALFASLIADRDGIGDAHLGSATIHLWRGETVAASHHARAAGEGNGDAAAIRRVLAAAALLEGRAGDALALLDALVRETPADAETRTWRAEALLRDGQPEAALAELRVAGESSPDHSTYVVLRLLEGLAELRRNRRPRAEPMLLRAVATLCGDADSARVRRFVRRSDRQVALDRALATGSRLLQAAGVATSPVEDSAAIESILETALAKLGGNRTYATPTRTDGGNLAPLVVAPPVRVEVTAALRSVRIGGYDEAHRRLTLLTERYPDWAHGWFYRAELKMWMGLLDEARSDLEVALAKDRGDPEIERSRWPPIGLAGVHLLQGRPREALQTIERGARRFGGQPAEPYFAWRGEILRASGRLEEARAVLERVCPPGSCRVGSLITLALTCRDLGDRDRPGLILAPVGDLAPGLMIEVTRNAEQDGIIRETLAAPDALARLSDDETRTLLERALHAMRGNRSASCLTFVDASNRLRAIPPNGAYRFVDQPVELHELRAIVARL